MTNPRRISTFTVIVIEDRVIRRMISAVLSMLMPVAFGQEKVASQINAIPAGAKIEVRLKSKHTVRGTKGAVSNATFTLADAHAGDRQIAFDDVVSVKQLKSHAIRNVLIVVAIGVAALGITIGILLRCGPFGCGKPV